MDPRIGMLMQEGTLRYYAFVNGYHMPEFVGSLEAVEVKLGLRAASPATAAAAPVAAAVRTALKDWDVTMHFQYPAWDEVDGILYSGISARTKSEANRAAARQALSDGHAVGGRGRYWFTATEADGDSSAPED